MPQDHEPPQDKRKYRCRYLRQKLHFTEPTTWSCVMCHTPGPPGKKPPKCFKESRSPCKYAKYIELPPGKTGLEARWDKMEEAGER